MQKKCIWREQKVAPHVFVSACFQELLQLGGGDAVQLIQNFGLQKCNEWGKKRASCFQQSEGLGRGVHRVSASYLAGAVVVDAVLVSGLLDPFREALDEFPDFLESSTQRSKMSLCNLLRTSLHILMCVFVSLDTLHTRACCCYCQQEQGEDIKAPVRSHWAICYISACERSSYAQLGSYCFRMFFFFFSKM